MVKGLARKLLLCTLTGLAACGTTPGPQQAAPEPTVFDRLLVFDDGTTAHLHWDTANEDSDLLRSGDISFRLQRDRLAKDALVFEAETCGTGPLELELAAGNGSAEGTLTYTTGAARVAVESYATPVSHPATGVWEWTFPVAASDAVRQVTATTDVAINSGLLWMQIRPDFGGRKHLLGAPPRGLDTAALLTCVLLGHVEADGSFRIGLDGGIGAVLGADAPRISGDFGADFTAATMQAGAFAANVTGVGLRRVKSTTP